MDRKKLLSDVLLDSTQEARMEKRKIATELFMLYEELVKAGFNENQALFVLNLVVRGGSI